MKKFTYFLSAAIVVALASCSTSNDVVSKNGIQKRKYNSGFYVDAQGKQAVDPIAEAKAKSATAGEWVNVAEETTSNVAAAEINEISNTPAQVACAPAPAKVVLNPLAANSAVAKSYKGFARKFDFSKADFSSRASVYSAASANSSMEPSTLVYILLILLVPFGTTISMYLYEGDWTKRVTVNLILTLLCGLPGLIHALVIIFGGK